MDGTNPDGLEIPRPGVLRNYFNGGDARPPVQAGTATGSLPRAWAALSCPRAAAKKALRPTSSYGSLGHQVTGTACLRPPPVRYQNGAVPAGTAPFCFVVRDVLIGRLM